MARAASIVIRLNSIEGTAGRPLIAVKSDACGCTPEFRTERQGGLGTPASPLQARRLMLQRITTCLTPFFGIDQGSCATYVAKEPHFLWPLRHSQAAAGKQGQRFFSPAVPPNQPKERCPRASIAQLAHRVRTQLGPSPLSAGSIFLKGGTTAGQRSSALGARIKRAPPGSGALLAQKRAAARYSLGECTPLSPYA